MNKKSKGFKYVLTIAYKHGQDQCEYIQEEIVDESDKTSWEVAKLELRDYFEEIDIAGLTCCIVGKT
tara:strand:+ start:651 stop:851 length:201 start_codon:yes stop_codon:yes gene_type:complete